MKQRTLKAIAILGAIENSPILLSLYLKNIKPISNFSCTNNIVAVYASLFIKYQLTTYLIVVLNAIYVFFIHFKELFLKQLLV